MKRLCIAITLLALVIAGCFWSSHTIQQDVERIVASLEAGQLDNAFHQWKSSETKFGALLLHNELEEADRLFARLQQATPGSDDYRLDLAELIAQLNRLPELEQPSLKNIF